MSPLKALVATFHSCTGLALWYNRCRAMTTRGRRRDKSEDCVTLGSASFAFAVFVDKPMSLLSSLKH